MMESPPASPLEVSQAEFAFQFLVVAFDAPSQLDDVDENRERHVLGQGREPVLGAPDDGGRYVALNPAWARLVKGAEDWRSSSVAAHLAGRDDDLVCVTPLLDRCAGRFADPDLNRDGAAGPPDSRKSFLYRVARGRRVSPSPRSGEGGTIG